MRISRAQAGDGTVYASDGHRGTLYAIKDSNEDGLITDDEVIAFETEKEFHNSPSVASSVLQILSGHASHDAAAIRIRIRIVRHEHFAKRQKPKPCKTKARSFFPLLPVGSQESVFKVPKRGRSHAAIRVTPKHCDSCVQGALRKRTVSRRNLCDAEG